MTSPSLPVDHAGLAVLSNQECLLRLRAAPLGRIAFMSGGDPVILPVNHGMDGDTIVFRTNPGSKLFAADNELSVSFEIDGSDPDQRSGWSVVVSGVATRVEDPADIARLNLLGIEPWANVVERMYWVRIRTYMLTGRQVVHAGEL